jgi:hypothetical protein
MCRHKYVAKVESLEGLEEEFVAEEIACMAKLQANNKGNMLACTYMLCNLRILLHDNRLATCLTKENFTIRCEHTLGFTNKNENWNKIFFFDSCKQISTASPQLN